MFFIGFGVRGLIHIMILPIEIIVKMRPEPGSLLRAAQTHSKPNLAPAEKYKWMNSLEEKAFKRILISNTLEKNHTVLRSIN